MEPQQTALVVHVEAPVNSTSGFPPDHSLSSDPALAALYRPELWVDVLPKLQNHDTQYNEVADRFDSGRQIKADHAKQAATAEKEAFVNILNVWDAEHDKTIAKSAGRTRQNRLSSKETLIAKIRSNISQAHSWNDVLDELRKAADEYNNPKGIGTVRKWFRSAANKAEIVEPFLELIPNTDYGSVVCGGLKFIIQACVAAKKFREEAFDLVEQLPEKIGIVSQYSELYSTDPELQLATNELYTNILLAIEGFIFWLMKDHTFEWLRPLFRQSSYDPLQGKIAEVGKSSRKVEEVVKLCDSKRLSEIASGIVDMKSDMSRLLNGFLFFLRGQAQNSSWLAEIVRNYQRAQQEEVPQPEEYISQKELLRLLRGTGDALEDGRSESTQQVLRAGFSMTREDQNRSKWLMSNETIGKWFRSSSSTTLLVNGNSKLDRITPISFFCAMLVRSLSSLDSIVVLSHFCGVASRDNSLSEARRPGSSGLLHDLLTQLVRQWKFGKLTCLDKELVERLQRRAPKWRLQDERRLFRKLVSALPAGQPLFVIIDGINWFEISELKAETKKIVAEINQLVHSADVVALIKVFVTAANRSFEVKENFEESEKLEMPSHISGVMSGFADSQFDKNFGDKVAKLKDLSSYSASDKDKE
ncbi:uncharacterized protein B0T15DRAFT_253258 [Chaetomium strumarium]|uniref:Uncharacterized protein n=1 Tax=Chaetomium strumarium TaxID=1170767 RepID=A0AAJ0GRG4_9PEZI|nr:hypothetical protein B0T15DRAFT_253258 [Chaetomium strumarium]